MSPATGRASRKDASAAVPGDSAYSEADEAMKVTGTNPMKKERSRASAGE